MELNCKAKITKHAEERLRERFGIKRKSIQRIVNRVLEKGLKHKEAKGKVKKYMTELYLKHSRANNIHIYGSDVYIFRYEVLITVLHLPSDILNALLNNREKRRVASKEIKKRKKRERPLQAESGRLSFVDEDELLYGP